MVWLRIRRWVVRPIFWFLVLAALLALGLRSFLASDFVAERVARIAERELSRVLGRPVQIGRLSFELLPASVEVHDLLVPSDSRADPPLLTVRTLRVEIDTDAIRNDLVDLQTVRASGVKMNLVLREDGSDNLPRFPASDGKKGRFAVRIGGLFVEDGELDLGDRRVPLDLRARAVFARLVGLGGTDLQGSVTAQEVETTLPGAIPWPATVSGKIRVEHDRIEILQARVASAALDARVSGTIGWVGGTHGDLRCLVRTSAGWLDERGYLDGEIRGDLRFDGGVRFARREMRVEGELSSPALTLFGVTLDELSGRVSGDLDRFELAVERGNYRGGILGGGFAVELDGADPEGQLDLQVEGAPLRPLLDDLGLPDFRVAANAHGDLNYRFPFRRASRGVGSASLELVADSDASSGRAADGIAADGVLGLEIRDEQFRIVELALHAGEQTIDGSGEFALAGGGGRFDAVVHSGALGELAALQPFVAVEPAPLWLPTDGIGELELHVQLGERDTAVAMGLDLTQVTAPGLRADRVRGRLVVDGSSVHELDLVAEKGRARARVAGALSLAEGLATTEGLDVTLERWPVEETLPWSPLALPLAGPVDARVVLRGPFDALSGEISGTVSPVTVASVAAERLEVALQWDDERLLVERADLVAPAGRLAAAGRMLFADQALDFHVSTDGLDLGLPPFSDLLGQRAGGDLQFEAVVSGTPGTPQATLRGGIDELALLGRPLAGEERTEISADLTSEGLALSLAIPELVTLQGGGPWRPGESADLRFDIASDRLDHWFELALGTRIDSLGGVIAATLSLARQPESPWMAEMRASRLDLAHGERRASLVEPSVLRLEGARLTIPSLYLASPGDGDELFVGGSIDFATQPAALDLKVQATTSVAWLEQLAGFDFDGRIELLSVVGGTLDEPALNGQAALRDGRFIPPGFPHSIDRLTMLALLYPDAIVLDSATGDFAGGRIAAFGRVELPGEGVVPSYRIQAALTDAAIRYPEGFLLRGQADLTMQSSEEGRQIRGSVDLDRASYVQDINLSLPQLVQRFLTRTRLQVEETDDLLSTTYLNVAIEARNAVRVRNNLARLNGGGELSLRGTLANPVLFGELTFDPGGLIEYGGNDYQLERGVLTFADPSRVVPVIDVVTTTRIDEYEVRINLSGALDRLATGLSSNPPLPDYDVLALLATGSTSGEDLFAGSGGSPGSSAVAAESLLYGQAANLIGSRVGTLFGVDRLKIDPLTTGENVSSARVSVGKRLTRTVYVTYSVDPSSTAQQVLEVDWKLTDDLTLVLTQNGDGSYALDARWGRRF